LQQALLSFEQQADLALASQVAHSFFVAQDARKREAAAMRTVEKRGGAFCEQALRRAEAATRVRIAIFMCICVGVNRVVMVPIHQTPGSGIGETNDKFHLCK
jgi:hypothetical protein